MDFHTISLFSGVSMLDEGLRTGLEYLGIAHRTICHVEREAYACAVLAARMEEGSLDAAPIWTDVVTFDAHAWRGKVDCIVAGFPCQDISIAGRRAGLDGKRSGLFFEVVRIAEDCDARYIFLENVSAIASATATVVDQAEGELEERAAARVMGELADRGWDSEWITLSASDVGASHGRARWFCWAWRSVADTSGHGGHRSHRESRSGRGVCTAGDDVDDAERSFCDGPGIHARRRREGQGEAGIARPSDSLAHAERAEWGQIGIGGIGCIEGDDGGRREEDCGVGVAGTALAQPTCDGRHQGRAEPSREQGRLNAAQCCGEVADARCSNAWRGEHLAGTSGSAAEHHPCGNDLAHACSAGQQGSEFGRTRNSHRGGAGSTWTN